MYEGFQDSSSLVSGRVATGEKGDTFFFFSLVAEDCSVMQKSTKQLVCKKHLQQARVL